MGLDGLDWPRLAGRLTHLAGAGIAVGIAASSSDARLAHSTPYSSLLRWHGPLSLKDTVLSY